MDREGLYKQAYFQCARRAILENELLMKEFAKDIVKDNYSEEKLARFNKLLTRMYDNDMFDIIMGQKKPDYFKDTYDLDICTEIANYAENRRNSNNPILPK